MRRTVTASFLGWLSLLGSSNTGVACQSEFLTAKAYQDTYQRWYNTYAVTPVVNRGETDISGVGEAYHVGLTHNTNMDLPMTFPTPLLSISHQAGVFSLFYKKAISDILYHEYESGRHPMPERLFAEYASELKASVLRSPRQVFYFATALDGSLGAFVELYDSSPIALDSAVTATELRLGWRHPERGDEGTVILELMRGYVGAQDDVRELEQTKGLMRKVATYIDQNHLAKKRKVILLASTFDNIRAVDFVRRFAFRRVPDAKAAFGPWHVLQADGADFVRKFGSDAATAMYYGASHRSGVIAPLYDDALFRRAIGAVSTRVRKDYEAISAILMHGGVAAAADALYQHLSELGSFEDYASGLYSQQREDQPLVWF